MSAGLQAGYVSRSICAPTYPPFLFLKTGQLEFLATQPRTKPEHELLFYAPDICCVTGHLQITVEKLINVGPRSQDQILGATRG